MTHLSKYTRQWSLVILVILSAASTINAANLAGFISCIAGTDSTCTLDPNWNGGNIIPWNVTTPIVIGRPVTVKGNASYPGQVSLIRAAAIANIMEVTADADGVTIENLVFDGNKPTYTGSSYTDLQFDYGSWNNYVNDCIFLNSPGFALDVVYYTYIQRSEFYTSDYVGIVAYSPYGDVTDIGIYSSYFERAGTNAVFFNGGAHNSTIYDTDFYENHYTCSWNSPRGQILLDPSTSGIYVQNNIVDGNYSYCPSYPVSSAGLEGYGSSHSVTGNTFKRHRWFGVYFTAASGVTISSNTIANNYKNGIELSGTDGSLSCASSPTYTINSNTIEYNSWYGIYAHKNGCSAGPSSSTISMSGNSFTGNGYGSYSLNNP